MVFASRDEMDHHFLQNKEVLNLGISLSRAGWGDMGGVLEMDSDIEIYRLSCLKSL